MSKLNIIQPALTASSAIAPTTYSGLASLTPSSYIGQSVLVTDVGVNGSVFTSNGAKWIQPAKIQLINAGAGWIVPSLAAANAATYSQTGTTLTITSTGHNIPATENGGFIYLAIASGTATAGWFSNFTWVSANSFTCTSAESLSTSGTVNTNTAETVVTPLSLSIKGGIIGKNGQIISSIISTNNNNANSKIIKIKLDTFLALTSTVTTATQIKFLNEIRNRNNEGAQVSSNILGISSGTSNSLLFGTIDTSLDRTYSITLQSPTASDYKSITSVLLELSSNDN